ncbi:MAG: hypothetical protein EOO60_12030, partial [Hymenobacter sp.]
MQPALQISTSTSYFCQVNNMDRWAKQPQRVIPLTEDFGLYQNPERVLKCVLHLLYDAKMYREYPTLRYQGKVCFGALYLLDNMCWEIGRHRRWQLLLDNMPPAEQEKLAKLRSFQTGSYDSSTACMLNESVFINRKDGLSDQTYKRKSAELRQLIEQAITEATGQPYALTQEARAAIYSAIGEQFDNVLEHVPHAESAQLCCFYDRTSQELTIMIFNFGPTFAEKLKSSNLPPEVAGPVKEMVTNYTTRHWFIPTKAGRTLSEEDALTLLALQEGISSRLEFDPTRGFGLLDYIDHCFTFSSHCRISIVSGTTAINIDNKYPIGRRYVFGRERRVLALNPENDLLRKPDPNYVRSLSVRFPGVIIETTIPLAISTLPPCLPSPSTSTSLTISS